MAVRAVKSWKPKRSNNLNTSMFRVCSHTPILGTVEALRDVHLVNGKSSINERCKHTPHTLPARAHHKSGYRRWDLSPLFAPRSDAPNPVEVAATILQSERKLNSSFSVQVGCVGVCASVKKDPHDINLAVVCSIVQRGS